MTRQTTLNARSHAQCELCHAETTLAIYEVTPTDGSADRTIFICPVCIAQIEDTNNLSHWHCLQEAVWSPLPAVQVTAYRILKNIAGQATWAQDLLDSVYLDPEIQIWADAVSASAADTDDVVKDSNGSLLPRGGAVWQLVGLITRRS